jgi:hypothetical protein
MGDRVKHNYGMRSGYMASGHHTCSVSGLGDRCELGFSWRKTGPGAGPVKRERQVDCGRRELAQLG